MLGLHRSAGMQPFNFNLLSRQNRNFHLPDRFMGVFSRLAFLVL